MVVSESLVEVLDDRPMVEVLEAIAREMCRNLGYSVPDDFIFATTDNPRGELCFKLACAAWEAMYGDSPDPAEIEEAYELGQGSWVLADPPAPFPVVDWSGLVGSPVS